MKRVAVIRGEDAAIEVVDATLTVLRALDVDIEWTFPAVGAEGEATCGSAFPDEARQEIDRADAVLFGATSGGCARALRYLRWGKQTYANVRPARFIQGSRSPLKAPEHVNFVIVRENLEDLYVGIEGEIADLEALGASSRTVGKAAHELGEGAYAIKAITVAGVERVVRFACELARERAAAGTRPRLTITAKHNMLPRTDGLFVKTGQAVAAAYPELLVETLIIDDFAHRLVVNPGAFDVVVMPNLYGDILSDTAAGLMGGLGMAPSGCFGDRFAYFEPAHGTAPDIAGKGIANPTATMLSAVMLLRYLGEDGAAGVLERAVDAVFRAGGPLTKDAGGDATTAAYTAAVLKHLQE